MHVWQLLSCVWLFSTPWTVVRQVHLSMELSRQEYWSSCHLLLRGSSRSSHWTQGSNLVFCVSCIGRRILYDWVNWEATISTYLLIIILNINVLNSPIKRPKWLNRLKTTTTYKSFYFLSTSKLVQLETKGSQTDNEGKKKDTMQMKMKR